MKQISSFLVIFTFLFFASCDTVLTDLDSTVDTEITTDYLTDETIELTTYMGDMEVVRLKGKPGIDTFYIGTGVLSEYEPCFILYIATGAESTGTVSSAIIKFDGVEILNTSDFSGDVYKEFKFEICNLNVLSNLEVEIRGEPGSYLDIWINGKPLGGETPPECIDADGKSYAVVKIGDQWWMAENLAYETTAGSWAYANDDNNVATYGRLYDKATAIVSCPAGWHLPTNAEWEQLAQYIDAQTDDCYFNTYEGRWEGVGGHLKTTSGWSWDNNGSDDFGFSALPGGHGEADGGFYNIGEEGFWWASDTYGSGKSIINDELDYRSIQPSYRLSVRCVKNIE